MRPLNTSARRRCAPHGETRSRRTIPPLSSGSLLGPGMWVSVVASALEFLPQLSPALASILFGLWLVYLVYRIIRSSQETSLLGLSERQRKESDVVSCAAYVGLFLVVSLLLLLVILLVYRGTVSERRVSPVVPQELPRGIVQVSLLSHIPIAPELGVRRAPGCQVYSRPRTSSATHT